MRMLLIIAVALWAAYRSVIEPKLRKSRPVTQLPVSKGATTNEIPPSMNGRWDLRVFPNFGKGAPLVFNLELKETESGQIEGVVVTARARTHVDGFAWRDGRVELRTADGGRVSTRLTGKECKAEVRNATGTFRALIVMLRSQ